MDCRICFGNPHIKWDIFYQLQEWKKEVSHKQPPQAEMSTVVSFIDPVLERNTEKHSF